MSSLSDLNAAKAANDASYKTLKDLTKDVIRAEIISLFETYSTMKNIVWAQKNSEYNDEGLYPGITGPYFDIDDDDYDWYYDEPIQDGRLANLENILNTAGENILSDIFYDDSVTRVTFVDGKPRFDIGSVY